MEYLATIFKNIIINPISDLLGTELIPYFSVGALIQILIVVAFLFLIIRRLMI